MKSGKSLIELAQELQRQSEAKIDYMVDTRLLELSNNYLAMHNDNDSVYNFVPTELAHNQIAQRLNIPVKYYQKMRSQAPELLSTNVNHWFANHPERRLVRTLDGNARAFLSDRYRRLDNFDLAEAVLPVLAEMGQGMEIISCELTEQRMYIKAINKSLELEVKPGDVVQAGVCISNSEVGLGSLKVEPLIYRLVCTNGLISKDYSTRKYHIGRTSNEAFELYSNETLKADNRAFYLKIQDTVRAVVDFTKFSVIVNRLKQATEQKIEGNPVKAVEAVTDKFSYNQEESSGVLSHLIQGGDLSAYGLVNAITRTSQDLDYDRATDLERDGAKILDLSPTSWKAIATAK